MSSSRSSSRSRLNNKPASPAVAAARAPWIDDGIDYGPASAAVRELALWALAVAERDVEDWPAARKRVRNTRRFVLARLDGKDRRLPIEDVLFTASLLARIFDDDLGLDLADALAIFDSLELPTESLPAPTPRSPSHARGARPIASAPQRPMHVAPPLLRFCDECGYVHEPGLHVGYRNAA